MYKNDTGGKFIAFDGPNGVGKSTTISKLKEELEKQGYKVYNTAEPTKSEFGQFVRKISEKLDGKTLGLLVAANRYEHIYNEIIPKLKENYIVLTDRYILSSFILQCMDGMISNEVYEFNNDILLPDLQVCMFASEDIIQDRLKERDKLTRFEKDNKTKSELKYMEEGINYFKEEQVKTISLCNEKLQNVDENIDIICRCLKVI